ncbi:MAG: acetylxylan esterase [Phycisphaerales bacterium]|nr:MAG: acetylxylan esterase [Phycisphaerales bacterium]
MEHIRTKILLIILSLGLLPCSAKAQVGSKENPNKQDHASSRDTLETLEKEWEKAQKYRMLDGRAEEHLKTFLRGVLPKFTAPQDIPKWESKVPELREAVLKTVYLRGFPAGTLEQSPTVVWQEVLRPDTAYTIRKLRYEIYPGYWIPALLYEPATHQGKMPVVLNPNGHHSGGKAAGYKQARCINLAKRGMLALNFEFIGMGQLQADSQHNNMAQLNATGLSGVGLFYLAMKKGLDILLDHENADPTRVAMTGLSGGGWQTIVLSALDPRITASIPVAGYTSLRARLDHPEDIGDLEQVPVDLATTLDYQHMTAMLAPRPALLILNEKDDCCFQTARTRPVIYDAVRPTYQAYGVADLFETYNNSAPGTHNYERDNRSQLYRFLNKCLGLATPPEDLHRDSEILSEQALHVEMPIEQETVQHLAMLRARRLTHDKQPPKNRRDRDKLRRQILAVLRWPGFSVGHRKVKEFGPVQAYSLDTGDLTVPLFFSRSRHESSTQLIVADQGGRQVRCSSKVLLRNHIFKADIFGTGENRYEHKYQMFVESVGYRLLGIQVQQILACATFAQEQTSAAKVDIVAHGVMSTTAALFAAALEPELFENLTVYRNISSLTLLAEKPISYDDAPSLFCFGLLEITDIPQLVELLEGVSFHQPSTGLDSLRTLK